MVSPARKLSVPQTAISTLSQRPAPGQATGCRPTASTATSWYCGFTTPRSGLPRARRARRQCPRSRNHVRENGFMIRWLLWLLAGIVLGGIVHLVAVLILPRTATQDAYSRLTPVA